MSSRRRPARTSRSADQPRERSRTTSASTPRRAATLIALGAIITEGQTDEIEVPALEPGEYFFVCDLHVSEMNGTLVVEG
jgi:plastocyanin